MTDFIYQMPCLTRYVFNHNGGCMHVRTRRIVRTQTRECKAPAYQLEMDNNMRGFVTVREIVQYVKHLKSLQEFDPMVYHHFVHYRPVFKYYKYNAA